MKRRVFVLILVCASGLGYAAPAKWRVPPVFSIDGPTVVAFFPVTEVGLKNGDTNEALGDFQHYASTVDKPLQRRGIKFYQSYASSFRLKDQRGTQLFTPKDGQCGYYFSAPSQKPHVEYGVMTDEDLLNEARKYLKQ
jgi:hypothetical protein